MENKTATITAVSSVIIALAGLGFGFFTWYQDRGTQFNEKQAQERKEIVQSIEGVEKALEKRMTTQEKAFQNHLLKNQQDIFDLRQELSLISSSILRAQRQYEYVQSQSKLDNEALKKEIIREIRKK